MREALRVTRELVELTDRSNINTTDLSMGKIHNWHGALKRLEKDIETKLNPYSLKQRKQISRRIEKIL